MNRITIPTMTLELPMRARQRPQHRDLRPMNSRLSQRVQAVPPSGIRKYFDIAATMDDVISLGIGEPDFVSPPPILQAGITSLQRGHTSYTSNSGIFELREAVTRNLRERYGARWYDPETEVLITVGVSEAMYLAMQAILDPGDEVIVPSPVCELHSQRDSGWGHRGGCADLREGQFLRRSCGCRGGDHPAHQGAAHRLPVNPTGAIMDMGGMLEMARIAEKHDLIVISDEIYDRLVYGDHEHIMFAALPGMAERTIHLGGMSKDYAMTGWRIGYALGPDELLGAMRKIHQYLIMSAPTTGQEAALAAFTDPATEEYVQQMVASYDMRRRLIVDGLNSIGLTCFEPKGAFYAFPSVRVTGHERTRILRTAVGGRTCGRDPGQRFRAGRGRACSLCLCFQRGAHRKGPGAHGPLRSAPPLMTLDRSVRVAVVQAAPVLFDRDASIAKACSLTRTAASQGAQLVLLPEAFVPAYPRLQLRHGGREPQP